MTGGECLHHNEVPGTLGLLADLFDHQGVLPDGYEPTGSGAWVDWDLLCRSSLSSIEVAAVRIAQVCALAECHGGLPGSVAAAVREAVDGLTAWWVAIPTVDPDRFDLAGSEGFVLVEPVGLDPYQPDQPTETDRQGCEADPGWWQETARSRSRSNRRRSRAGLLDVADPGGGPQL